MYMYICIDIQNVSDVVRFLSTTDIGDAEQNVSRVFSDCKSIWKILMNEISLNRKAFDASLVFKSRLHTYTLTYLHAYKLSIWSI